jgi:hypothetical protein
MDDDSSCCAAIINNVNQSSFHMLCLWSSKSGAIGYLMNLGLGPGEVEHVVLVALERARRSLGEREHGLRHDHVFGQHVLAAPPQPHLLRQLRRQSRPVLRGGERRHAGRVLLLLRVGAVHHAPHAHDAVLAAGGEQPRVGAELHRPDGPLVRAHLLPQVQPRQLLARRAVVVHLETLGTEPTRAARRHADVRRRRFGHRAIRRGRRPAAAAAVAGLVFGFVDEIGHGGDELDVLEPARSLLQHRLRAVTGRRHRLALAATDELRHERRVANEPLELVYAHLRAALAALDLPVHHELLPDIRAAAIAVSTVLRRRRRRERTPSGRAEGLATRRAVQRVRERPHAA